MELSLLRLLALCARRDIRRMPRVSPVATAVFAAVALAAAGVLAMAAIPTAMHAQADAARGWNDAVSRAMVERATARRARQLADSGLVDYVARAHGYLTFLGQVGEGFLLPPKVIKADELMLEVYWRAPNSSKQWIVGRRDTLLLPTDINYHRDHLGIVQNNFPDIIRLGDGDEVRDVAHPLSARGLATYEYLLSDSLRFEIPGRVIDVYEVKVRPRNDREPAAVGALYIARDDAQVVRMAFSFTRSALRDRQLEDVSIVLENSLIEGQFWLPRRQEIEIRRTGSWMDFPARGIIRGRWEIGEYRVNQGGTVAISPGPEIVLAPPERRARFRWPEGTVMDGIPADVQLATDDDVRQVQEEARRLVRGQALDRTRATLPSARGASDLLRVTRAEGLAVGGGVRRRLGRGLDAGVLGRVGFSDHEVKATLSLGWERADGAALRGRLFRDYREAGDDPETSRARNTIAAQEFGSDYTQPFDTRGVGLTLHLPAHGSIRWRLEASHEWHDPVSVAARPSNGRYEPTLAAWRVQGWQGGVSMERLPGAWWGGSTLRARASLRGGHLAARDSGGPAPGGFVRGFGLVEWTRSVGRHELQLRTAGGFVESDGGAAPQLLLFAGGPTSAPGYDFHAFRSRALVAHRVEWRTPVNFFPIPLGRWGRIPGEARLAPFAVVVGSARGGTGTLFPPPTGGAGNVVDGRQAGWYPAVGLGLLSIFDLVRVDVARGLRDGRWTFGIDVARDFWPIL